MPPLASLAASLRVASPSYPQPTLSLPSAYPQPTLSLPSAYPLILSHPARGDGGGGGDAAAGELGGESARRLAAPGGLRPPMPLEATEAEAQPTLSLSSAYPQPTL
jgi:hypothetical protein